MHQMQTDKTRKKGDNKSITTNRIGGLRCHDVIHDYTRVFCFVSTTRNVKY